MISLTLNSNFKHELVRDFEKLREENSELVRKLEVCNDQIQNFIQIKDELERNNSLIKNRLKTLEKENLVSKRESSLDMLGSDKKMREIKEKYEEKLTNITKKVFKYSEYIGLREFNKFFNILHIQTEIEKREMADNYELQICDLEATNQKLKRALSNKEFHDSGMTNSDPYLNQKGILPKVSTLYNTIVFPPETL